MNHNLLCEHLFCVELTIYCKSFYVTGCAVGSALTFCVAILLLGIHTVPKWENRKGECPCDSADKSIRLDVTDGRDKKKANFHYLTRGNTGCVRMSFRERRVSVCGEYM